MIPGQIANVEHITFLPIEEAIIPKNFKEYYVDYWFVVINENILLYKDYSPQCNLDKAVVDVMVEKLYPGAEARQIPLIFVPKDPRS